MCSTIPPPVWLNWGVRLTYGFSHNSLYSLVSHIHLCSFLIKPFHPQYSTTPFLLCLQSTPSLPHCVFLPKASFCHLVSSLIQFKYTCETIYLKLGSSYERQPKAFFFQAPSYLIQQFFFLIYHLCSWVLFSYS